MTARPDQGLRRTGQSRENARLSPSGPLASSLGATLAAVVGSLAEPIYRSAIQRRNRRFDAGEGVTKLPLPVVSVGNLSVGGTGKTPIVSKIVRELAASGRSACIAMRGYSKERKPSRDGGAGGRVRSDEADEYRRTLPGVPVVAQPDRIAGVRALLAEPSGARVDCVILDDGFQHRRLARDLDIVLIDASRSVFHDRLLPAGWLREPVASLRRAGVVVVTHAELVGHDEVEEIRASVRSAAPAAVQAVARHAWASLACGDGALASSWLEGKSAVAACAIGNPTGFLHGAARACRVVGEMVLPDHDPYSSSTIDKLRRLAESTGADAVLTTEKDWSKIRNAKVKWPCPVVRPRLDIVFDLGWKDVMDAVRGAVAGQPHCPQI